MQETQESISKWAEDTFGPVGCNLRVAVRALEEMIELLYILCPRQRADLQLLIESIEIDSISLRQASGTASNIDDPKAGEEMADVIIVLSRLADRMGSNLGLEVNKKMAINRSRTWALDNTGHGYHVT
jgi:NTP pyrophosphatase (non-canonical NTP hydrolase)